MWRTLGGAGAADGAAFAGRSARFRVVGVVSGQVSYLWPAGSGQRVTRFVSAARH
jgi:hypothetical protein